MNSDGNGTGGDVDVEVAGVFQATGSVAINGKNYNIYTGNGSVNSGKITIIAQGSASLLSESLSPDYYSKDLGKSQGIQPDSSSIQVANDPIFHLEIHQDLWPDQINLPANKQQQLEGFIKQLWDAGKPLAEFVLGTMYQFLYDNSGTVRELLKPLQLTPKEEALWERTLPSSTAFKLGRTVGGGAAIVQGIAEFLTGSVAEAGGGGLCATGIGCPGGAVAIAAGAILQSHGAATAIFSAGEEGKLLRDLLSPNRMESSMGDSEPYINHNPRATADEIKVGEFLDQKAQSGQLPEVTRVEGAAEIRGTRSGDYRFIDANGKQTSADLFQPQSANPRSISQNIIAKSGQADTVVVELGPGRSSEIKVDEARIMANDVINTPDHGVNRVIVVKNGQIIVDVSR